LLLDDSTGSWNLLGGTVSGGRLAATGSNALVVSNGSLVGVTVDGTAGNPSPLDLRTNNGASVSVSGGLTLDGATAEIRCQSIILARKDAKR